MKFWFQAYKSANKDGYPFKNYGLDLTSDRIFFLSYAQVIMNQIVPLTIKLDGSEIHGWMLKIYSQKIAILNVTT